MGTVDIVFGEVAQIHIRDDVVLPSGKLDIGKIAPLARMGYYDYTVIREVFEMRMPAVTSAAVVDGLEGARREPG